MMPNREYKWHVVMKNGWEPVGILQSHSDGNVLPGNTANLLVPSSAVLKSEFPATPRMSQERILRISMRASCQAISGYQCSLHQVFQTLGGVNGVWPQDWLPLVVRRWGSPLWTC
jgi:hypothetical protein